MVSLFVFFRLCFMSSGADKADSPFIAGLNYVAAYNMSMVQSTDVKDAMLAGLTKKKPTFAKL